MVFGMRRARDEVAAATKRVNDRVNMQAANAAELKGFPGSKSSAKAGEKSIAAAVDQLAAAQAKLDAKTRKKEAKKQGKGR